MIPGKPFLCVCVGGGVPKQYSKTIHPSKTFGKSGNRLKTMKASLKLEHTSISISIFFGNCYFYRSLLLLLSRDLMVKSASNKSSSSTDAPISISCSPPFPLVSLSMSTSASVSLLQFTLTPMLSCLVLSGELGATSFATASASSNLNGVTLDTFSDSSEKSPKGKARDPGLDSDWTLVPLAFCWVGKNLCVICPGGDASFSAFLNCTTEFLALLTLSQKFLRSFPMPSGPMFTLDIPNQLTKVEKSRITTCFIFFIVMILSATFETF